MVFIDELQIQLDGGQNVRELSSPHSDDVEFFIAVRPRAHGSSRSVMEYELVLPDDPKIMVGQLDGRHRNARGIYELSRHLLRPNGNRDSAHLRVLTDPIKDMPLPRGDMPLWIVRDASFPLDALFEFVGANLVESGQSVIVIGGAENEESKIANEWINKQGEEKYHSSWRFINDPNKIRGSEDDVVISLVSDTMEYFNELLTRAREKFISISPAKT